MLNDLKGMVLIPLLVDDPLRVINQFLRADSYILS